MTIVILGAGNVALHLIDAILKTDNKIIQIYSRTEENAIIAAKKAKADYTNKLDELFSGAELYIICLKDDIIFEVSQNLALKSIIDNKLTVHMSGSVNADVLSTLSVNYGVLYPLYTFSKTKKVDFKEIILCIEAPKKENEDLLRNFAIQISEKIEFINSYQRKIIHLSAVFACNFSNNMYASAHKLLSENNLDFSLLFPLIKETTEKIFLLTPPEAQTGPAIRKDKKIIDQHLIMLKNYPNLPEIYRFVSQNIIEYSQKEIQEMDNFKERLKDIKAFVFDVDGVFSDNVILSTDGDLMRFMNVKDGFAVKTAIDKGLIIAIITGGNSESVRQRFNILGVTDIYLSSPDKVDDYQDFYMKYNIKPENILYMGDDIPDFGPMKLSGLATCPADAVEEIQNISHYISDKKGGEGCVRDVIEQVLRAQGKWFKLK